MIPQIQFGLSRVVNEFCHLSVLYADLLPAALRAGMLDNKGYRERNHHLRQDHIRLELQRIGPFASESGWYDFARGLMKRDQSGGFESLSDNSKFAETFGQIRQLKTIGFERIWRETRPRLEEYKNNFSAKWSPISDRVLSRLSILAKTPWWTEKIRVHFIDCLNGGFAWSDSIGFATLPDMEVQKKFLAHELSELITPQQVVRDTAREAGFDPRVAHTVVDMLGYFSVRDFIVKPGFPSPEKKGVRPNPNYYPAVEELYPAFERYAEDPSIYTDFRALIRDIIPSLKKVAV